MKDEQILKQIWQTPEVVDLDVDKTESGADPAWYETMTARGSAS